MGPNPRSQGFQREGWDRECVFTGAERSGRHMHMQMQICVVLYAMVLREAVPALLSRALWAPINPKGGGGGRNHDGGFSTFASVRGVA